MNNWNGIGRLTKDAELKYTPQGKAVANFTLAVNRPFKNNNGETEADFLLIQVWGKLAENVANFTRKGSMVGVSGRIQTRNYEGADGKRVYVTEIIADSVQFLDPKPQNNSGQGQQQNQQYNNGNGGNQPNYNQNQQYGNQNQQNFNQNQNQQYGNQQNYYPNQGQYYGVQGQQPQPNYNQQGGYSQGPNYNQQMNGGQNGGAVQVSEDDLPF